MFVTPREIEGGRVRDEFNVIIIAEIIFMEDFLSFFFLFTTASLNDRFRCRISLLSLMSLTHAQRSYLGTVFFKQQLPQNSLNINLHKSKFLYLDKVNRFIIKNYGLKKICTYIYKRSLKFS